MECAVYMAENQCIKCMRNNKLIIDWLILTVSCTRRETIDYVNKFNLAAAKKPFKKPSRVYIAPILIRFINSFNQF